MGQLCADNELQTLLEALEIGKGDDIQQIDDLLRNYPDDPRLHFLKGSVLAGGGQLIEAYQAFAKAVEIAPDFAIARFQLGFFQLTSGEADNALATWGPLDRLPKDHYLRIFVEGLRCLIRDEFAEAVGFLAKGIEANQENIPLNGDMQLIINECSQLLDGRSHQPSNLETSATSMILNQYSGQGTKH